MDNFAHFSLTEARVYRFVPGPRRLQESLSSQEGTDDAESERLVRNVCASLLINVVLTNPS